MLKRKLKRKVLLVLSAILLFVMSGCAKINGDYQIYEDGEYSLDVTFLIPKSIAELQDIDLDKALIMLRQNLYIGGDVVTTPIETMRDGVQYTGYQISRKKAAPSEDGPVSISVDKNEREVVFTLDNTEIESLWISTTSTETGENQTDEEAIETLRDMGLEVQFIFAMPGEVLSSSGGIIQNNTVVFDVIDNSLRQIIIRSKIPGLTLNQIIYISGAAIFLIGGGIFAFVFLNKKNPIKFKKAKKKKEAKPKEDIKEEIPLKEPELVIEPVSPKEEEIKTPEVIESPQIETTLVSEPLGVDMSDLVSQDVSNEALIEEFYSRVNHSKSRVSLELGDEIFEVYKNKQTIKKKYVPTKEQDLDLSSTTSISKKAILDALNS